MARILILLALLAPATFASTAADLARQLHQTSLDPEQCYKVVELNFLKEDLKVYLTSGYLIFAKPLNGVRHGAVFVASEEAGDAEILVMPPVRSERLSLATFTDSPNLDEHFKSAVLIFTDNTAEDLLSQIETHPSIRKSQDMGDVLAGNWGPVVQNLTDSFQTRLVHDVLSQNPKAGFFYMAVAGKELDNFDVLLDPAAGHDQVTVGRITDRNGHIYFDTWTSFASKSARSGAPPAGTNFSLDNFRIDSTIDPDLKLTAVTRVTLTPKQPLGLAIPFNITGNMHITAASIDSKPVEVFSRESLRSNLILRTGNEQILLIPETPLAPDRPHEIEFHHQGDVILKAGDGIYFVTLRGTWYPRIGVDFANYDLTFRCPKHLTLVATGDLIDERTEGDVRITHRKTAGPIRFAGFNLGDFRSLSVTQSGYKIEVYANRHVESALESKIPLTAIPSSVPGPFPRRQFPEALSPPPVPAVPDPTARLRLLARDVADALEFMSSEFGPAPVHNVTISPIPGTFGQGFPGLVYLATLAYIDPEQRPASARGRNQQTFYSELLVTHEVAHQWWGNLVIAASYQDEWLMESLANYSALLLLERRKGIKAVDIVLDDYRAHLLTKSDKGHTLESAGPITWGYRLQSSLAPSAYRAVTYEKGTWIMHMLRRRLGDEKFLSLLRDACNRYRFSTISTEQFRELAGKYMPPKSSDPTLKDFFDNWVYGVGVPSVKLAYNWRGTRLTGTITQRDVSDDFGVYVPVEVQTGKQRAVYWLATGSDPVSFSIPMKLPPTRVALLSNDCLLNTSK